MPTVRSCIAALLVLIGLALGRDAISLRLLAVGALLVLLVRPEVLAGPSFQFSFAAVTAIIALHSTQWARNAFHRRDEPFSARLARGVAALVATGVAVEIALVPIGLFHFHKAGLYSVAANIVAIPMTTFIVMPLESAALLLDLIGAGAPLWFLTGLAIDALLGLAHAVGNARGAVLMMAAMPPWAFATMIAGGLWLCLWTSNLRLLGLAPFAIGATGALLSPTPDLLVTGDGRHLALVAPDGTPHLLRARSGEFVRDLLSEASGYDDEPRALAAMPFSSCSRDSCVALIRRDGRQWRLLATRSSTSIEWRTLVAACAEADIVVSDRWLPRACTPRWLKLDRKTLERSGGVSLYLRGAPRVETVADRIGRHPWAS